MGGSTEVAYPSQESTSQHARLRCLREDSSSLQSVGSGACNPGSIEDTSGM
jgi:hypothetical protein